MAEKLKARAAALKVDIPALVYALGHMGTPLSAKVLAVVTVAYALSPIDLIPDFIPVLGYLDDLILLPALVALTLKLIPASVMEACRERVRTQGAGMPQKRAVYALPILLFYGLIIYVLYKIIVK